MAVDTDRLRRLIDAYDVKLPIERAWTLPSSWYVDKELHEFELHSVFRAVWLKAGRAEQVREPGAYLAGWAGGEPFVVTRDKGGALRAFYNVCRHHAAIVAEGAGCADVLTCPYHGWSYHLDGRLCKAPRLGAARDFDPAQFGLVPMHVAEWQQFVWVHLGSPESSPDEEFAELGRRLDAMGASGLRYVTSRSYEVACNWKVFVENYLDGGYHVPHAHPELASQLDMKGYRTEVFGRYSIQSCPGGGEAAVSAPAGASLQGRIGSTALYAWIYPNFMINRYGPAMDTNLVIPLGPKRTRVDFDFYFIDSEATVIEEFIQRSLESADVTQKEDMAICESVQRGLASSAYGRGRLAPTVEVGEHHFYGLLAHDLDSALTVITSS